MAELEQFWTSGLTKVENSSGAIKAKFRGIQLYPLLRVRIFYSIAQQIGLFDNPHPNSEKPKTEVQPISDYSPYANSPVMVVPFRRQVNGTDPYSDRIVEILSDANNTILPNAAKPRILSFENDIVGLRAHFEKKFMPKVTAELSGISRRLESFKWGKILDAFEKEFGVSLEKFRKYPPRALKLALAEQRGFAEFFKAAGTKDLFIVNAYSEQSIVLGARMAGVKVFEIQHGFITPMHAAYSYPTKDSKPISVGHAPDVLLTWGEYWTEGVQLPAETKVVVSGPTSAFIEYRNRIKNQSRIVPKQILFTSQGAVATELLAAALKTATKLSDHKVIYRLHPNEHLDEYQQQVEKLTGGQAPANFSLSHKDPIFLDLVSQSEYLIGAFSTTLYEGLALGCKVLVLPLAGFEHVKPAIESGDMTLISNLEELPSYLAQAKPAKDPSRYYA